MTQNKQHSSESEQKACVQGENGWAEKTAHKCSPWPRAQTSGSHSDATVLIPSEAIRITLIALSLTQDPIACEVLS